MGKIALSEMLRDLRAELVAARSEGEDSELRFEVADVELEIDIATTKEAGGGGGVKFWVYEAEANVKASDVRTHRLRLRLKPHRAEDGAPFEISDEDDIPG
ncbi:hypothetical protein ThidrDRAFT_2338 [Thiorhodococcus drewsii AZ1]|uniref:Trypsin-co-occurring domain-containing protein n=1 Tax=Thiorhodococcus drewsii AZ1 TaxID=765913 RepID=G2E225_9GAMM|nr:trypco2 family protein [Thiorhodococcus drewsii]EGV30974.1 hypothetical protein ThidrDRAFT_2338 [Thiorhodococcus drewsii AZ1]